MKANRVLFLILFLTGCSLAVELIFYENDEKNSSALCLECDYSEEYTCISVDEKIRFFALRYECTPVAIVKKTIILKKTTIELEYVVKNLIDYVPESHRRKNVLKNKMNDGFLNDINNMALVNGNIIAGFCYKFNIYDNGNLIISFETNGRTFYDRKNKLMYTSKENLLRKYCGILEENACR